MPRNSPIAQPVRQWRVALRASRFRGPEPVSAGVASAMTPETMTLRSVALVGCAHDQREAAGGIEGERPGTVLAARLFDLEAGLNQPAVLLVHLGLARAEEADVEGPRVADRVRFPDPHQRQREAAFVEHHREVGVRRTGGAQIEVAGEELACRRYVVDGEVQMVELHRA